METLRVISNMKSGCVFIVVASFLLFASAISAQQLPSGKHVFYIGQISKPSDIGAIRSQLAAASIVTKEMFKGNGISWKRRIDEADVDVFATKDRFWIHIVIQNMEGAKPFLDALLGTLAKARGLSTHENGRITSKITIPIVHVDGTVDMAGMQVMSSRETRYYEFVPKEKILGQYRVSESNVDMKIEEGQLYWIVKTQDKTIIKVKAMAYHGKDEVKAKVPQKDKRRSLLPITSSFLLAGGLMFMRKKRLRDLTMIGFVLFLLPIMAQAQTHTDYVIMYKSSLSGWDPVINSLHSKHADYQDLTFTTNVSEKLSDLQTIKPNYVIIVIEPTDGDPDFFDDVDDAMLQIDPDEFEDAVWTIITGFDAATANALVNAPDATDDHTLIIANPDGSLTGAGYAGVYLESIIADDDTHLGTSTHYINTRTNNDNDCTAMNLRTEVNDDHKDCVLFLDHGNTNIWALKDNHYFYGNDSNLDTWDGTSYDIENNENTFVYASACLTSRIHGNRGTNWSPWESSVSNYTGSATTSIALAWMEDSPGFYVSNNSVSYGCGHIKVVLLNMMKFGYTPAKAVMMSKNVYHHIIEDETTDDEPIDGDGDDLLLYLERAFMSLGDASWNISMAGTPPDYTIAYNSNAQQDQLPSNDRGYVYVDNLVKWQCTPTLTFNEELFHEPWYSADEDNTPFTFIYVENAGAVEGSYIYADDECAVIAGIFKPTSDTKSIDFVSGNPSSSYKLYEHYYYGPGESEAIELFKCKANTDELVWIVGAGITDVDSDGDIEWRINSAHQESFDAYYWIPEVEQTAGPATVVDADTRKKEVTLENKSGQTNQYVIAKVPVPSDAHNLSVLPSAGVSDIIKTSEADQDYAEFTVASFTSGESKTFDLDYDIISECATVTITSTGVPYLFVAEEGDTLAEMTFNALGNIVSVEVTAYPDSFPPNPPGYPNNMPVKKFYSIDPFGTSGFEAMITLRYTQAEFDASHISDESSLYCARWDGSSWHPYTSTVNTIENKVTCTTDLFSIWGIGGEGGSLPVELSSFTATARDGKLILQWRTESEVDNMGFHMYRSLEQSGPYERITSELIRGAGSTATWQTYTFTDSTIATGTTYWYKLEDVAFDGTRSMHGPIGVTAQAAAQPDVCALSPCVPNPLNPSTTIRYQLSEPRDVRLRIYDLLGQKVRLLVFERQSAGWYRVSWDGRNRAGQTVSSGVYLYRLEAGEDFVQTRRMLLLQ